MGNNPEACRKEANPETVQRPESESSKRIEVRMRKGYSGRIDEGVKVTCSLVDAPNNKEIPETEKERAMNNMRSTSGKEKNAHVDRRPQSRTLETVFASWLDKLAPVDKEQRELTE